MPQRFEEPSKDDLANEEAWLNKNGLGEGSSDYKANLNSENPRILKAAYEAWIEELKDDLAIEELTDPESSKVQKIKTLIKALEDQILILDSTSKIKNPEQRKSVTIQVRQKIAKLKQ